MTEDQYYSNLELYHHGVKGMKWGVRRYTNSGGSLTTEGKKHKGLTDKQKTALKVTGAVLGTAALAGVTAYGASKIINRNPAKAINNAKKAISRNHYFEKNISNIQSHVDPGKKYMYSVQYEKIKNVHFKNADLGIKADKNLWGQDVSKRSVRREGLNSQLKWVEDKVKQDAKRTAQQVADKERRYEKAIRVATNKL